MCNDKSKLKLSLKILKPLLMGITDFISCFVNCNSNFLNLIKTKDGLQP